MADVERNAGGSFGIGDSFSEKSVRQAFIRKVYSILTAQLLVTLGIIMICIYVEPVKVGMYKHPLFILIPAIMTIVLIISMACCQVARRKFPLNIILLSLFTLCEATLLGFTSAAYDPQIVWIAIVTTTALTLALTLFAFQTKWDLTIWVGGLMAALFGLIMFGFLLAFLREMPVARKLYATAAVIIFGLYIIVDTQLMMGGKRYEISPEEYVFAALSLYVDIINLFLQLLQIFGGRR